MALVAALAVAMGIVAGLGRRRATFRQLAAGYARESEVDADTAWGLQRLPFPDPDESERLAREYWRRSEYHDALRMRYERAARSPWLPVAPDPPPPD